MPFFSFPGYSIDVPEEFHLTEDMVVRTTDAEEMRLRLRTGREAVCGYLLRAVSFFPAD
jgi:hypothetical protein